MARSHSLRDQPRCPDPFPAPGEGSHSLQQPVLPAGPFPSPPGRRGCPTWMTLMLRPVSWASCSRMWRVGLGVAAKAALRVSSCLALMVVRGPLRLVPEFCSSFSLLVVSLSEEVELSVSLVSSCMGSWRSGDKLLSVHEDTVKETQRGEGGWMT